jgi:hypothetical protein
MKWLVRAGCLVDEGFVEWEVEADSPAEAENIGYQLALKSSVADSGNVDVHLIREDKQAICDRLLDVLQITRSACDLLELEYDPEREIVRAVFEHGTKTVNVAMDSGSAMIRDIMKIID